LPCGHVKLIQIIAAIRIKGDAVTHVIPGIAGPGVIGDNVGNAERLCNFRVCGKDAVIVQNNLGALWFAHFVHHSFAAFFMAVRAEMGLA